MPERKSHLGRPSRKEGLLEEFAARLGQAAENNPRVPRMHQGRYTYIVDEFKKRGVPLRTESVRKWFHAEVMPLSEKVELLAQILMVDVAWLAHGEDSAKLSGKRRQHSSDASAVANVVAGLIALDGSHPAFPDDDDRRAAEDGIDLYAVIKGASYAFRIATGKVKGDTVEFSFKPTKDTVVLGVVRDGFAFSVYDISEASTAASSTDDGGRSISIPVADLDALRVESFSKRI